MLRKVWLNAEQHKEKWAQKQNLENHTKRFLGARGLSDISFLLQGEQRDLVSLTWGMWAHSKLEAAPWALLLRKDTHGSCRTLPGRTENAHVACPGPAGRERRAAARGPPGGATHGWSSAAPCWPSAALRCWRCRLPPRADLVGGVGKWSFHCAVTNASLICV